MGPSSGMPSLAVACLTPYGTYAVLEQPMYLSPFNKFNFYIKRSKVTFRLGMDRGVVVTAWGEVPKAPYGTALIISPLSR